MKHPFENIQSPIYFKNHSLLLILKSYPAEFQRNTVLTIVKFHVNV